ncbi:MAG: PIN domain-containing protein [Lachnospiraceae bacterium]|nr:PIN domain-containing protein [Lachnospiraceae bacterium]
MRNAVKEYIEYSDEAKSDLWNTGTFVFDTNIFLDLYRYSNKTRNQLIESFEWLKTRIWMPYQVAAEFCKDRYSVIDEVNRRFDYLGTEADKLADSWKKELRLDSNDTDIVELAKYLKEWVKKKKNSNYLVFDAANDEVFNRLLDLFEGKAGKPFSSEEKQRIEQEGEKRYADKTPPGYKDNKKAENKYGDLLVWKEMLGYAKSQGVDIIFVTHDQKEDWWNISGGKTIGPRIELRKEFYEETGKRFHMYTMSSFLSFFIENKGKSIDKTTIDEVELFASVMRKKVPRAELRGYYESLEDNKEKEAAKLRFKIANLERKNKKRRISINVLIKKAREGQLSTEEEIALKRNEENLIDGVEKLEQLNEQLSQLMPFEG